VSVTADINNVPIFVLEDGAKLDLLRKWNVAASQIATDAKGCAESFRNANIVLIPNNDDSGYQYIDKVGSALTGIAKSIRVLVLPGLDKGHDILDWAGAGGTAEQLMALSEQAPQWMPAPTAEAFATDMEAKKAAAEAEEQRLLDELARSRNLDYAKRRRAAAKELGINVGALDREVEARREAFAVRRGPAPLFPHWIVEPWPEPVNGDALLPAIIGRIKRHAVLTPDETIAVGLWILMAWAHQPVAVHSPILLVTSPEANSGKSTLIDLISYLVPRGLASVGVSQGALYRTIEMYEPTIAIDEADVLLADNEALRSVVNSGWTRGSGVLRCVGNSNTPHLFPTFCPKAIGMKGKKLPDTTLSRCITIEMRRKKASEPVERFQRVDDVELNDLRQKCLRWTTDNIEALKIATPEMPGFTNRLADNWHLMLAIADLAGGEWPGFGRRAASVLAKVSDIGDASTTIRLLADINAIFDELGVDRIASSDLADALGSIEGSPWPELKGGRGITTNELARLLKPYGIAPATIRISADMTLKGYQFWQFRDAFERYLGGIS